MNKEIEFIIGFFIGVVVTLIGVYYYFTTKFYLD